jgi:hypothetical protein
MKMFACGKEKYRENKYILYSNGYLKAILKKHHQRRLIKNNSSSKHRYKKGMKSHEKINM